LYIVDHLFLQPRAKHLLSQLDFMLVKTSIQSLSLAFGSLPDENSAEFVVKVCDKLAAVYCGPILINETGEATAPEQAVRTRETGRIL
jgi:hypothetical protein